MFSLALLGSCPGFGGGEAVKNFRRYVRFLFPSVIAVSLLGADLLFFSAHFINFTVFNGKRVESINYISGNMVNESIYCNRNRVTESKKGGKDWLQSKLEFQ